MDLVIRRKEVIVMMISAVNLLINPVTGEESCRNRILIPRSTQYNRSVGEPLSVECPVQFCSQRPPQVTWCKVSGDTECQAIAGGPGISVQWEERGRNDGVYLLKFVSVHENHSGFYKCWADFGAQQGEGHVIKINVFGIIDTLKENAANHGNRSKSWITYLSISLRFLMALAASTLLFMYLRKIKANHLAVQAAMINGRVRYLASPQFFQKRRTRMHARAVSGSRIDIEPPTGSFEIICDDPATCDDEMTTGHSLGEQGAIGEEEQVA